MGNQMVTLPMTSRDPERSRSWPSVLKGSISRKQPKMLSYLATTANCYMPVCCEAVRLAILATARLLVYRNKQQMQVSSSMCW